MHRTKKITVTAMAAALLMAGGVSSAMAANNNDDELPRKVTICHVTGSETNRYVRITVSRNAIPAHRKHEHDGFKDIIPADDAVCPPKDHDGGGGGGGEHGGNCIADSSSGDTYNEQHGLINVDSPTVHFDNALAGLACHANTLNNPAVAILGEAYSGGDHSDSDGDCIADSSSGDTYNEQHGLINVGSPTVHFDNALAGLACHANTLNNPAVAILGEAYSGGDHSDSDGDCIADSSSGDTYNGQYGAINVGSPTVHLDNALAGVLCGANTANNPAAAIIGDAVGISSLGSGLLSGGPLGILGYGPGFVLSGLQTDVQVLANVLLQF